MWVATYIAVVTELPLSQFGLLSLILRWVQSRSSPEPLCTTLENTIKFHTNEKALRKPTSTNYYNDTHQLLSQNVIHPSARNRKIHPQIDRDILPPILSLQRMHDLPREKNSKSSV